MSEQRIQPDGSQPVAWVIQRYLEPDGNGVPKEVWEKMYSENFVSDLQKQLADHAARVAELERLLDRAKQLLGETDIRADRAERRLGEVEKESRAWRNRFIGERTTFYSNTGKEYETAIAYAESDANEYIDAFRAAINKEKPA